MRHRGRRVRAVAAVRIDVVTVFPDYLAPLKLSLLGKAQEAGLLDVRVHRFRRAAIHRATVSATNGHAKVTEIAHPGSCLDAFRVTGQLDDLERIPRR